MVHSYTGKTALTRLPASLYKYYLFSVSWPPFLSGVQDPKVEFLTPLLNVYSQTRDINRVGFIISLSIIFFIKYFSKYTLQHKIGKMKRSKCHTIYISKGNQTRVHTDKSMSAIKWPHNDKENK